jgi:hypothetical protein
MPFHRQELAESGWFLRIRENHPISDTRQSAPKSHPWVSTLTWPMVLAESPDGLCRKANDV